MGDAKEAFELSVANGAHPMCPPTKLGEGIPWVLPWALCDACVLGCACVQLPVGGIKRLWLFAPRTHPPSTPLSSGPRYNSDSS